MTKQARRSDDQAEKLEFKSLARILRSWAWLHSLVASVVCRMETGGLPGLA